MNTRECVPFVNAVKITPIRVATTRRLVELFSRRLVVSHRRRDVQRSRGAKANAQARGEQQEPDGNVREQLVRAALGDDAIDEVVVQVLEGLRLRLLRLRR